MEKLFVIVMAVCGKHFNMDFCFQKSDKRVDDFFCVV